MSSSTDAHIEKEIAQAQLDKVRLEIVILTDEKKFKDKTYEKQEQKLELEIASLQWQKSLIYRLGQFATVFTILATIITVIASGVGVWLAYEEFISGRKKENELKVKEMTEQTDKQYRSDLQQLLQYPVNEDITLPTAVFYFQDLREVVENGYKDRELDERRRRVGFLLAQLIRSPDYDLTKTRNLEFDRKAVLYCEYYANFLIKNPSQNMDILSRYKFILVSIHNKDAKYVENLVAESDDTFRETGGSKDQDRLSRIVYPFHGYTQHVALLKKSREDAAQNPQEIDELLNQSFCWFYGATKNTSLTARIYGGDENSVKERWKSCP